MESKRLRARNTSPRTATVTGSRKAQRDRADRLHVGGDVVSDQPVAPRYGAGEEPLFVIEDHRTRRRSFLRRRTRAPVPRCAPSWHEIHDESSPV